MKNKSRSTSLLTRFMKGIVGLFRRNAFGGVPIYVALLFCVTVSQAQVTVWSKEGVASQTYANNGKDTTVARDIAGANLLSYTITTNDSLKVDLVFEYRTAYNANPETGWTTFYSTSHTSTLANAGTYEFVLRSQIVERLAGVVGQVRCRQNLQSAGNDGNGVYSSKWRYTF